MPQMPPIYSSPGPAQYYPVVMPSYPDPVPVIPGRRGPPPVRRGSATTASGSSSGDPPSEEETIQDSQVGMTVESKNLYREDPRLPWQELSPEEIGINASAISASNKFALVVRREKRIGDTDQPAVSLHSITIQSPLIKALLGPVFANYQGINTNLKKLEFIAPFHEFFYRWTEFTRVKAKLQDETEVAHYGLLFDIISNEITPHIEEAGDLVKNGVISFEYLWSLFEPGTEIYSRVDDKDRLYLLLASRYVDIAPGVRIFTLTCRYVETDGVNFGFTTSNLTIGSFANVKPISDLNVMPSHLKPDIEAVRERLHARGKKFEQLNGFHHKSYNGYYKFLEAPFEGSRKRYASAPPFLLMAFKWTNIYVLMKVQSGRVIVDCGSFLRYNADSQVNLAPLSGPPPSNHLDPLSSVLDIEDGDMMDLASPAMHRMQQMARASRRRFAAPLPLHQSTLFVLNPGCEPKRDTLCVPTSLHELCSLIRVKIGTSLSEEHYVLCSPTVKGFCLRAKQWGMSKTGVLTFPNTINTW